jgi:hypothetical protein
MKKDELLKRVARAHQRVTSVLDELSDEQAAQVGLNAEWSAKDLLAHLTAWKERGATELVRIKNGTWQPQKLEMAAVHKSNAEVVGNRKTDSLSAVRADFERAHNEMLGLIAALPEELDETAPAFRVVNGGVGHIAHHAAQLEEWKLKLIESE